MAPGSPRLSATLPAVSPDRGGTQPPVATRTGRPPAGAVSCKEQLGSGPKTLQRRGLADRSHRAGSCKEQLGLLPDVHFSAICVVCYHPTGILKRTTFWLGRRIRRITDSTDAQARSDQRTASSPLG